MGMEDQDYQRAICSHSTGTYPAPFIAHMITGWLFFPLFLTSHLLCRGEKGFVKWDTVAY